MGYLIDDSYRGHNYYKRNCYDYSKPYEPYYYSKPEPYYYSKPEPYYSKPYEPYPYYSKPHQYSYSRYYGYSR